MSTIRIHKKDGTSETFGSCGRYGANLKLEQGWAVIKEEDGNSVIIPRDDIERIEEHPRQGW